MIFDINRFHFFVLLTWQFAIFFASQQIFPIFSNYVPEWQCDDGPVSKNCTIYSNCNGTLSYPHSQFQSAALEYGWICGSTAYLASLFSQIQFAGVLCGTFSFGALSDVFGRKPVAIFTLSVGIFTNFVTGLAPTWQVLLAIRFFVGLSVGGTLVVVCTFVMEMLLPHQRMALRAFFNWGVARLLMTLICMTLPEWRASSIACAITALPALLIVIFIFPESPTWLHNKGRLEEMRSAERYISRFAGVEYKPVSHKKKEHSKSDDHSTDNCQSYGIWLSICMPRIDKLWPHDTLLSVEGAVIRKVSNAESAVDHPFLIRVLTLCEMLHTKGLHRRLYVLWTMWFVASICGYATDLNSNTISGDFFVNQIIFSCLIAISKMVLVAVDTFIPSFSRRILHQGAQSVVCLCFFVLFFLTMKGYSGVATLIINVTGTIFIEYTWDACYLCAVESMETSCRASATGTCSLMARVGAIIAPVLTFANVYWPPSLYLAVVVIGMVNLVVSYFFLIIPLRTCIRYLNDHATCLMYTGLLRGAAMGDADTVLGHVIETKNVNLDSVTLSESPTSDESLMLANDEDRSRSV